MTQLHTARQLKIVNTHNQFPILHTGLLGHLTLDETSGQAATIRWDIEMDYDPATHYTVANNP